MNNYIINRGETMFKRNHIFMFIIVLFVMFMGIKDVEARNEQGAGGVGESTGGEIKDDGGNKIGENDTVSVADLENGNSYLNVPTPEGYTSCVYAECSSDSSCENIIQMDYSDSDIQVYSRFSEHNNKDIFTMFKAEDIANQGYPGCPVELFVFYKDSVIDPGDRVGWYIHLNKLGTIFQPYKKYFEGKFSSDGTSVNTTSSTPTIVNTNDIITINSCEDLLNDEIRGYLKSLLTIIKILIPLILIVLGTLDFAVAIFSGKDDDMKKNANKFIKRFIIAIIIFFIPSLLELLLTIASKIWGNIDPSLCGILD